MGGGRLVFLVQFDLLGPFIVLLLLCRLHTRDFPTALHAAGGDFDTDAMRCPASPGTRKEAYFRVVLNRKKHEDATNESCCM